MAATGPFPLSNSNPTSSSSFDAMDAQLQSLLLNPEFDFLPQMDSMVVPQGNTVVPNVAPVFPETPLVNLKKETLLEPMPANEPTVQLPQPKFNVFELSAEELKEELKLRKAPTNGPKAKLAERLVELICVADGNPERLSNSSKKRKRPQTKKEPERSQYDSEEAFKKAWTRWRKCRDNNNESVKRSREAARKKTSEHVQLCYQRQHENAELATQVASLRRTLALVIKHCNHPELLNPIEKDVVQNILSSEEQYAVFY